MVAVRVIWKKAHTAPINRQCHKSHIRPVYYFLIAKRARTRINPWPVRRGGPDHHNASKYQGARKLGRLIQAADFMDSFFRFRHLNPSNESQSLPPPPCLSVCPLQIMSAFQSEPNFNLLFRR